MSTFSELLRAIEDPNHVMKIRVLEKLNKKKINAKFGVFFNEVYLYIYVYIYLYSLCPLQIVCLLLECCRIILNVRCPVTKLLSFKLNMYIYILTI